MGPCPSLPSLLLPRGAEEGPWPLLPAAPEATLLPLAVPVALASSPGSEEEEDPSTWRHQEAAAGRDLLQVVQVVLP